MAFYFKIPHYFNVSLWGIINFKLAAKISGFTLSLKFPKFVAKSSVFDITCNDKGTCPFDFSIVFLCFVSNLLLVQRKKYYFNRATVSRNCSIVL